METIKTDVCVIGGGSGGLSVAAGAVQMGAKVVLVEGHRMGGDCLNYGCVPSKALIAAAKHAHAMTDGAQFGVTPQKPSVDYAKAMDHVRSVIADIEPHDSVERFESLGVQVIQAYGKFVSPDELEAGSYRIKARRFVIATGSSPFVPPIAGLDTVDYLTNETLFDLRERPDHLLIVGAGPIGLEMAQAHSRLGSKVTVIEGQKALGRDDPEVAEVALKRLRAEGIEIIEGENVTSISNDSGVTVTTSSGAQYNGSHILIAVGRKTNTDRLNLDAAGIEHDKTGVTVDAGMRSSNRKVYAIGDVAGGMQFTHVAGYHAGVIIRSMLFALPAKAKHSHIPYATYIDPEIAQVGLKETQAKERYGDKLEVLRANFAENDRARSTLDTDGFIKVMVYKGRPVGVSLVGPNAGELIQTWALAMSSGLKISSIAGMVAPYPTLGEINKRAAGQYYSPRLFESAKVKFIVRLVQKFLR